MKSQLAIGCMNVVSANSILEYQPTVVVQDTRRMRIAATVPACGECAEVRLLSSYPVPFWFNAFSDSTFAQLLQKTPQSPLFSFCFSTTASSCFWTIISESSLVSPVSFHRNLLAAIHSSKQSQPPNGTTTPLKTTDATDWFRLRSRLLFQATIFY